MALCVLVSKVCESVFHRWNVFLKRSKQTYKWMYTYKDLWKCVNNDKWIMRQNYDLKAVDMYLAKWLQTSPMPFSALKQGCPSFYFWDPFNSKQVLLQCSKVSISLILCLPFQSIFASVRICLPTTLCENHPLEKGSDRIVGLCTWFPLEVDFLALPAREEREEGEWGNCWFSERWWLYPLPGSSVPSPWTAPSSFVSKFL